MGQRSQGVFKARIAAFSSVRKRLCDGIVCGAMVLSLICASVATANTYWVVENQSNNVFAVDIPSRTAALVGAAGIDVDFGGLAFDRSKNLYAWDTGVNQLYTVNQSNGEFSAVGVTPGASSGDTFDINPVTQEGIVWTFDGELHTVDLGDGSTTFRTNLTPGLHGLDSAFDELGNLYSVDRDSDLLYRVNVDTGVATLIGSLGLDFNATNLGYNPVDDMLYAIEILDSSYPLYMIDPATGAAAVVGNISGLPVNGAQQVTMGSFFIAPEPSSMLVALLGALCAWALSWRRRR